MQVPAGASETAPRTGEAAGPSTGAPTGHIPDTRPGRALRRTLALVRRPYWDPPDERRVVRRWPALAATCVGTLFFLLSLTPSLVPRPWALQGVMGGITAAMGYGVGALVGWLLRLTLGGLWRRHAPWPRPGERWRARGWQAYYVLSTGLTITALSWSADAQRELRRLQDMPETLTWHSLMITLIALGVGCLLLLLARAVRLATRELISGLGRLLPRPAAIVAGVLISATVVAVGTRDVLFDRGIVDVVARVAESTNRGTKDGVTQPGSRYVSGSPHSLVKWDDLGYEGRNFAGSGLTARQIASVTRKPARDPVRVYVGEQSADGFTARARLAVRELERTGAFDREVLAIAGTTGMGWVNSTDAEPLEYLYGGDTAIVAVQYSYLPSWVSFLVDKEQAGRANRALVKAVRERWLQEPPRERPKLVVFGESLGAYGIEAAFDGPADLLSKVDGAFLAGSPNFSPIRERLTAARDPGSPVWRPRYREGRNFRFAQWPDRDFDRPPAAWEHPRVAYLQNASDAIVWWSWSLAFERPEWLSGPRGPDITSGVRWFPLITFWQTTVDMAVSYGVHAPHGHRYGNGSVEAWTSVLPPDGWRESDTRRLKRFMDNREAPY
ncbi:hypothetical protein E0L36_10645 [Streptomyces sp. AJS327]|uniref:alpha/beta hydrolase n=1 Tax=Streptomyces sp. AJS327 TaxID=2545265 RepID=UPI0015DF8526|nr:alpha/beta hydrolase [Streptomyces sp. AJS327]MBA0051331.1 hypothetical protein [Streptomyces sp. AJS327]